MPFGSRKFFSGKVRPGVSSVPAVLTVNNTTFSTTAKYGARSLQTEDLPIIGGTPNSQNKITVFPKDRNFFLNSNHAWTIEWWNRTQDSNYNDPGGDVKLAALHPDNLASASAAPRLNLVEPGTGDAWRCIGASGFEDGRRTLNTSEWVHFAMVSEGTDSTTGQFHWFINGVEQFPIAPNTQEYNDTAVNSTNRCFVFGMYDTIPITNFTGGILWDEIRISDTVRYTGNFTPPTSAFTGDTNTLALFHLDNNLTDSSVEGL